MVSHVARKKSKRGKKLRYPRLYDRDIKRVLKSHPEFMFKVACKVLGIDEKRYQNRYSFLDTKLGLAKESIDSEADLIMVIGDDWIVNFEINNTYSKGLINKNFSYICALYIKQLKVGKSKVRDYENIKSIAQINIDAYDHYNEGRIVYIFRYIEERSHVLYDELPSISNINIDFFQEMGYSDIIDLERGSLEWYTAVFSNASRDALSEIYRGDELMTNVEKDFEALNPELNAIFYYDGNSFRERDAYEIGRQEGRRLGEKLGAKKKSREMALKLFERNLSMEEVKDLTGLSEKELKKIVEVA